MTAVIVSYDERFGQRSLLEHALRNPSTTGDLTPPVDDVAVGPAVTARVNHGRWIADCPAGGCSGAEFVSFDRPTFFCCECRNVAVDHRLLPVLVPVGKLRSQIEAYLGARPPATRNWHISETVKQLRDENREHGIRIP